MRNLSCKRIECDEIWQFVYAKQKNVPPMMQGTIGVGDVWTWVAIDADTKLIPAWLVGTREPEMANAFICDLAGRLANRVQLSTDGLSAYRTAVESAFGMEIDFAQLIKQYGKSPEIETRYSPAECLSCKKQVVTGDPEPKLISTSYIERQNLTMRMSMRRFTRLTNGFSETIENHAAAVALHMMYYNFGRIHKTLRVTPAMETGISDHVWSLEEIAKMVEDAQPKPGPRGPYKKRQISK